MPVRYFQEIDDDAGGAPLRREISIRTASDAVTLPDNRGAGRTLDKAFVWGGERLERVITWVLSRTGRGPRSSIKDIIQAVYQSLMMPCACRAKWCEYWGPPEVIAPPTTYELPLVCEWLVRVGNRNPRCPKCHCCMTQEAVRTPLKSSKKLLKLIAASNKSSCYISLQLLTLLVTMFPSSREVFTDMGASNVLHELSKTMADQLDVDPLLASSRRALVSVSDAEILSLGREIQVRGIIFYTMDEEALKLVASKLFDFISHPENMVLALTIANQIIELLHIRSDLDFNTIYPVLLSRLASSSDPVEVAVLTKSLYGVINDNINSIPWLIESIKTQPQLLEHIPRRLRCLIDSIPPRYEQEATDSEHSFGRRVNFWRRAIWRYDPDDPEGEPDNDHKFFKEAPREYDGKWYLAKIDCVWWEAPVWETRARRLAGREEQGMEDREQRGRDGHRRRRPRSHSMTITAWPRWMKGRQEDEAAEWEQYWKGAQFVNFSGWPRQVGTWLRREREPRHYWMCQSKGMKRDWQIFWTKLSTRMRSSSVD